MQLPQAKVPVDSNEAPASIESCSSMFVLTNNDKGATQKYTKTSAKNTKLPAWSNQFFFKNRGAKVATSDDILREI